MKLHVAYDQDGKILAAVKAEPGGDRFVAQPGVTLAELDVPTEFEQAEFTSFVHLLHVDVGQQRLLKRSQPE